MPKIKQHTTFYTPREDTSRKARKTSASGSSAKANTLAEETVQFINAEVLDPPEQGNINFVGPYVAQVGAMALEDARSFLQGAEQIILAFLGKLAAEAVSGPGSTSRPPPAVPQSGAEPLDPEASAGAAATIKSAAATDSTNPQFEKDAQGGTGTEISGDPSVTQIGTDSTPSPVNMSAQAQQAPASSQPQPASAAENLEMIQKFMASLTDFHKSIAETAKNLQGDK